MFLARANFVLALPTGGWRYVRMWYDLQAPDIESSRFCDIPGSEGLTGLEAMNVAAAGRLDAECDELLLKEWPCPIMH